MGAYLGFDTEGYFDVKAGKMETLFKKKIKNWPFKNWPYKNDFGKANVFFKRIIQYKDRFDHAGNIDFDRSGLADCLRISYGGKIYEIRKSKPQLVLLPEEQQALILEDIKGLYMKYDYKDPKHYFIYDMSTFMFPEYPTTVWYEKELLAEKFDWTVGFSHYISIQKLDATTRKMIKLSEKHRLVLTLSV